MHLLLDERIDLKDQKEIVSMVFLNIESGISYLVFQFVIVRICWIYLHITFTLKTKPLQIKDLQGFLVTRLGLEPRTHALKGRCSTN